MFEPDQLKLGLIAGGTGALLGLLIGLFCFGRWKVINPRGYFVNVSLLVVVLGFSSGVVVASLGVITIPEDSLLVTDGGQIRAVVHDQPLRLWVRDPRLKETNVVEYSWLGVDKMKITSITPNPKVRELTYSVQLDVSDPKRVVASFRSKSFPKWLKFYLYEFNEAYSKELARFYNPMDDIEQEEFKELVDFYLQPHLQGTGLTLKSATFSLP